MGGSIKTGEVVRTLPRMPDVLVARPQARRYLDRWAAVTVVRGLQGYGKTTLVAGWLQDQPAAVRSVWVSARTAGSDPDLFARHLLRELRQAVPDFDNPLGSSAESRGCTADKALEAISRTLRNIPEWERTVIVVDDAQWLRDELFLNRTMAVIARHRNLHLVLCSRGAHPLERLIAGAVDTVTVPAQELLLTVPQVCELAERRQIPLSAQRAEQLHAALGGWAAAVCLVLQEVRAAEPHFPLARAHDYLRETVLPAIGDKAALAEFMRFSLAERLTHRLIRDLARDCDHDPDTLVRLIESSGLAERKYQADDIELVLPSFIRASLREVYAVGQPDDATTMHRRLAHWYGTHKGRGHAAFALSHAIVGRDWERAHCIWTHHSTEMLLEHPRPSLESLRAVPADVVTVHPWIRLAQAISDVAVVDDNADGQMAVLRAYAEGSRRAAAAGVAKLELPDALDVGIGAMLADRLEGNLALADALGGRIQQQAEALIAGGADAGDRLPWFHLQRGLTRSLRADHHEAATHYRLAWQHRRQATPRVAAIAAGNLALTYSLTAHPAAAEHWLTRCRSAAADQAWGQFATEAGALLARGMLALDRLDGESCRATL
ncbi:MAG: LuxR family transcriptional regulator, maltose regulon positive regulatory protein, partial [Mycobacterium sp.]|nr:LuxR family transcriptional regulator, maltose regulon positive regulatory protein [Mycobacterium sp.]